MIASLYVRISRDTAGQELGIERQEQECREFCETRGWTVGPVYRDNDLSAVTGVRRPGFEALLASNPEVVVCWHSDRFVRLNKELERVIDLGFSVHAVHVGHLDLSTPSGRAVARTLAAWATYELEAKGTRQKAANRQKAALGKPSWAQRPPVGFDRDGNHVPAEADALRRAYSDILEGRSLYSIAQRWSAGEVAPRGGKAWAPSSIRRILLAPRNAGIRVYLGEEVGLGDWEPIVSKEVLRGVEAVLTTKGRFKGGSTPGRKASSMLAGIAECGVCSGKLYTQRDTTRPTDSYVCRTGGHVTAPIDQLDSMVLVQVLEALNEETAKRYWGARSGLQDSERASLLSQIATLEGRLSEAAQGYEDGLVTLAQLAQINRGLEGKLETAKADLQKWKPAFRAAELLEDPEAMWEKVDQMPLEDLRQLVDEVIERVTVLPRGSHSRIRFGKDYLRLEVQEQS